MSSILIEIGSSLAAVVIAWLLIFRTDTGRDVTARMRDRAGPEASPVTVGLVAAITAVVVQAPIKWISSGSGLQWYEVVAGLTLAVGLGAIMYGVYRGPRTENGSPAGSGG